MTTFLRVKRRMGDEPQNALILCKRVKLTNDGNHEEEAANSTSIPVIAKFARTLEKDPEENVVQHFAKSLNKEELQANFKQRNLISEHVLIKARERAKQRAAANRYKILNCMRSVDVSNEDESVDKVTFIDMEDTVSLAAKEDNYVYDLYYTETEKDTYIDDCEPIYALQHDHELVFETCDEDDTENGYESEDSNSESNWRNDYPDTDYSNDNSNDNSDESIGEKDIIRAMNNVRTSYDLSDDEEDEDELEKKYLFAYSLDPDIVKRYGYKYALYKEKMKSLFIDDENKESSSSIEDI